MDKFTLPGYEIIERLGVGGMATVWMARQVALDRIVAIKAVSTKQTSQETDVVGRFRLEAQATARLNHPGIVQVYDAGEVEGVMYYVMEYVAGFTVGELLRRKGSLDEKHALLIAEGVAHSLSYAWGTAKIIHCDVKPDNIMIDRDGTVKVADLGLAKVLTMATKAPDDDLIIGTPNYTSPEQARGDDDLDCRADIYSLGSMLYHMVTGTLPFGYCRGSDAMDKHISSFLPDPVEVSHSLSMPIAWMIEKMMVKDRDKRTPSWTEVLDDITAVLGETMPTGDLPETGASTVIRSERRSHAPMPRKRHKAKEEEVKASEDDVPKKKIVLTNEMREALQSSAPRKSADMQQAVFAMGLLFVVTLGLYSSFLFLSNMPRPGEEVPVAEASVRSVMPPRSTVTKSESRSEPVTTPQRPLFGNAPPKQDVEEAVTMVDGSITWRDPRFVKGARSFNSALELYEAYLANTAGSEALAQIEKLCRGAISAFESCKAEAPEGVDVQKFLDESYRMISDCRQFTLVESAKSPKAAKAERRAAATPAAAEAAVKEGGLALSLAWNTPERGGENVATDLYQLLANYGRPNVDLTPDPSIRIFENITYLMPAQEAAEKLGLRLSSRRAMDCPGFPRSSFNYYSADGVFGDGFNKLLLITDTANRVVAVQLVNEHPDDNLWLDAQDFVDTWHAYNFAQVRTKARKNWKIAHRVNHTGRIIRLDSELVDFDQNGYFGLGSPKERVMLYIPQPLVDLILFRIEQSRA